MDADCGVQLELEDGEIDDAEDNYTPLERPANYSGVVQPKPVVSEDVESEGDEVKSSSDSNSDSDINAKKPKLKPKIKTLPKHLMRKKYDIWCSSVQEDVLLENLVNCDVSHIDRSRNVETYCTGKMKPRFRSDTNNHLQNSQNFETYNSRKTNKRTASDRSKRSLRPTKRTDFGDEKEQEVIPRLILDTNSTINDSEEDIAKDIANKLCEEKEELILSVVEIAGKIKSLNFFKETQQIEAEGGMMILNNTRRRTPGGVFLYLVKHDNELTSEQQNQIFNEEKLKYKQESRIKKRIKNRELRKKIRGIINKPLPELLTRHELELQSKLKKETVEFDVKNPPPSPATDGPENSTDGMENLNNFDSAPRDVINYDDDCLDVGLDMDLI